MSDSELRIPSSGSNPAEVPRHTMAFPITAEATALKINWLATITSPLTPCLVGSERNLEFWMSFFYCRLQFPSSLTSLFQSSSELLLKLQFGYPVWELSLNHPADRSLWLLAIPDLLLLCIRSGRARSIGVHQVVSVPRFGNDWSALIPFDWLTCSHRWVFYLLQLKLWLPLNLTGPECEDVAEVYPQSSF